MSRYLAFVSVALSASSVLAAPQLVNPSDVVATAAGIVSGGVAGSALGSRAPLVLPDFPPIPDTTTVSGPLLNSPRKRDMDYPKSTKDCLMSEHSEDSHALSYSYDGRKYSQDCLAHMALLVSEEKRKPCRAPHLGYEEECLFKKALEEDWTFDLDKAKEDELAWRAAHPEKSASEEWLHKFPTSVGDCKEKEEKEGKDWKKSSDDWSSYSVTPTGDKLNNNCLMNLAIASHITFEPKLCSIKEKRLVGELVAEVEAVVGEVIEIVGEIISVIRALITGCLFKVIVKIIELVGLEGKIVLGLLEEIAGLIFDILYLLTH